MEEPGRLQSMGLLESDATERLHFHFSLSCIGEGNSNPLQCSCLENPGDGEAWLAAIYGVAQSWTRLKRLSSSSSSSSSSRQSAYNTVQEAVSKTILKKNKCNKAKWLSEEALQIAEERREAKGKGARERYTQLNAEFQRIARGDKRPS